MNQMKSEQNGRASDTEKSSKHVLSGWCVHSKFAFKDVFDPLKMKHGKECEEKFVEHIEDEVKWLYAIFL